MKPISVTLSTIALVLYAAALLALGKSLFDAGYPGCACAAAASWLVGIFALGELFDGVRS